MNSSTGLAASDIKALLDQDRVWSAYALADLDPDHQPFSNWHRTKESVLLHYTGLEPPVLFAYGNQAQLLELIREIPAGDYQISFPVETLPALSRYVTVLHTIDMWRMCLVHREVPQPRMGNIRRLNISDLQDIERLYRQRKDAPDGFHPRQLSMGPFIGIRQDGRLVATAGVHVFSSIRRIAAIGNVFTDPAWRGQGFARACSAFVLRDLLAKGIETIVLNVAQSNHKAVNLYRGLGFDIHCPFNEGMIKIGKNK